MDGFGLEAEARMTTWHIMIPSDIEPDGGYSQDISEGNYFNFFPFLPAHLFPILTASLLVGHTRTYTDMPPDIHRHASLHMSLCQDRKTANH